MSETKKPSVEVLTTGNSLRLVVAQGSKSIALGSFSMSNPKLTQDVIKLATKLSDLLEYAQTLEEEEARSMQSSLKLLGEQGVHVHAPQKKKRKAPSAKTPPKKKRRPAVLNSV